MSESRPFDFLYDAVYSIPTAKNYCQFATNAVQKTSEKGIRPYYDSMFSDVGRYPRIQLVYKTEEVPLSWEAKSKAMERNENIFGKNLVRYVSSLVPETVTRLRSVRLQKANAHKINIDGIGNVVEKSEAEETEFTDKRKIQRTRGTQTDFRDSETQTSSWISPYTLANNAKTLDFFTSPLDDIATVYGVEVLENEHKINELERELLTTSKQNLRAQIAITEKIEKIEWITKEKRIDRINKVRMEYAETLLYRHALKTKMDSSKREERVLKMQEELSKRKLESLMKRKEREIRRLERKYKIEKFTSIL